MIVYTVFLEDVEGVVIDRLLSPIRFEIGDKFELGVSDVSQYTRDEVKAYLGKGGDAGEKAFKKHITKGRGGIPQIKVPNGY